MNPGERLKRAAELFESRNAEYGSAYKTFGPALLMLFPDGEIPAISSVDDANRLGLIFMCLSKLKRYAHNFKSGGHVDSARDLQVFAAMLEELTLGEIQGKE